MIKRFLAASVLLTTACTPPADPPAAETSAPAEQPPGTAAEATVEDTCNAARYNDLIGSNISEVTIDEGPDTRIVAPDSMITQDFRTDRVNIIVDEEGQVTSLECY